jgi:hypothetical protein
MPMSGLPPELAQMLSQKGATGGPMPAQPPAQPPMPQMSAPLTAGGPPTDFNALAHQMAGPAVEPVKRQSPMAGSGGMFGGFGGLGGFGMGGFEGLLGGMDIGSLIQMYQQQQAPPQPPQPVSMLPPGMNPGLMF